MTLVSWYCWASEVPSPAESQTGLWWYVASGAPGDLYYAAVRPTSSKGWKPSVVTQLSGQVSVPWHLGEASRRSGDGSQVQPRGQNASPW